MKNALWLFLLTVGVLLGFIPSYQQMQDLKQRNHEYEKKIQELVRVNTQLQEEKRLLEDDPVYLEKVGREKMGLIKDGETVYKIVPVAP